MPPRDSNTQRGLRDTINARANVAPVALDDFGFFFLEGHRGLGSGQGRSGKGGARVDRAPLKFNMT